MPLTLIASDDFNRANAPVGSNWAYIRNTAWTGTTPSVSSNTLDAAANGVNYQVIRWVGAGTFTADQQSQIKLGGLSFQSNIYRAGAVARCGPDLNTSADFYAFVMYLDAGVNYTTRLIKMVNGTETALVAGTAPWINGDILSIEVEGTTIRGLRNGVLVSGFTATDSDLTSGAPGILIAGGGGVPALDDWAGNNIDAPPSILSGDSILSGVTAGGGFLSVASSLSGDAVLSGITADGGMGLAPGVITTPVLKNNTGTTLAWVSGIVANIYHPTTGALVVRKTGLTSNGSGIVTISDVLLSAGTTYAYELDLSATSQGRRLPTGVAA